MTESTDTRTLTRPAMELSEEASTDNSKSLAGQPAAHGSCIACGACHWQEHFAALLRCGDCGYVRAQLDLPPEEAAALYSEEYFCGREYSDYLSEADLHRRNFARRYREITKVAGHLKSVFEVGCAYGFWLECLSRHGIRSAGIDLCEAAAQYARSTLGQQATSGDFLALPLTPGEYEAFCMWDTIEHLAHPEQFVSRIAELLPAGGWFFATTGDIGSRMARWRGPRWRMIHPPTHLHYFSADTMRRFLQRHGLEVVHLQSVPYYRNLRSVLANLQVLGKGAIRWLARAAACVTPGVVQRNVGVSLDLGDIMLVCARKR